MGGVASAAYRRFELINWKPREEILSAWLRAYVYVCVKSSQVRLCKFL